MSSAVAGTPLIRRLLDELSARGAVEFHPLTAHSVEPPASEANAFELVVRRPNTDRFVETVQRLGFKEAGAATARKRPGGVRYFAYDPRADGFVQLRVRFEPEPGVDGSEERKRRCDRRKAAARVRTSGGLLIALVGADGAGKSSALDALSGWLSPHFRVARIHMGKPRWSWITVPIKATLKVLRGLGLSRGWGSTEGTAADGVPVGLGPLLWHVTTARDRCRAYRRARRLVERGALVLCDRFPLHELASMDGPRAGSLPGASRSRLTRLLTRLEERYYAAIGRPDLLLVLRVRPEVALGRRPEDPAVRVRQRAQEILEVDWSSAGAHVVNADRPMAVLHRELKSWIWTQI
ncbi:MAG: hypothetical protein JSU66_01255 [Deltaproteobacteria bacterium]|nr:MAG: hypothetical protein JSU66_01255 [Deltaproteobacteria bacterium]